MSRVARAVRLLAAGKARGLAERALARLPAGGALAALPPLPELPPVAPRRRFDGGRPLRLLVAGASLRLEGAPLSAWELVSTLADQGAVAPVAAAIHDGPLRHAYEQRGIAVHAGLPDMAELLDAADFTAAAQALAVRLLQWEIDAVLAVTWLTAPVVEAARLAGIPVVWNPRETVAPHHVFRPFGAGVEARALACLHHPARVVFVAEASRAPWARLGGGRFHVIANTLSPARAAALARRDGRAAARAALGLAPEHLMVLTPATLCARKGQRDIVAAAIRLKSDSNLRFVMVGDAAGSYARRLRRELARLPEGLARLVPAQADMAPWYHAADAVLLPTRGEAAPRVVLEALAAGLPLVVAPVDGVTEQVRGPGDGALFCPPGDGAALAAVLSRLEAEDGLRADLAAAAARRSAEINDFTGMVAAYGEMLLAAARED